VTYLQVLLAFVLPPLIVLALFVPRDLWRRWRPRAARVELAPYLTVLALVLVALLYTTPWDNYLVATGVWWYSADRVLGVRIGWVPLEEYCFFVMQTVAVGLWTVLMRRHFPAGRPSGAGAPIRVWTSIVSALVWIGSMAVWLLGWPPGTYLALILAWSLPPILIQAAFGADLLWANRRLILAAVAPPTLYLWLVDFVAIRGGAWMMDPPQTLGIELAGVLPVEEMVFFTMTNILIAFGITLVLCPEGRPRACQLADWMRSRGIAIVGGQPGGA